MVLPRANVHRFIYHCYLSLPEIRDTIAFTFILICIWLRQNGPAIFTKNYIRWKYWAQNYEPSSTLSTVCGAYNCDQ